MEWIILKKPIPPCDFKENITVFGNYKRLEFADVVVIPVEYCENNGVPAKIPCEYHKGWNQIKGNRCEFTPLTIRQKIIKTIPKGTKLIIMKRHYSYKKELL